MKISLIISTYNWPAALEVCLKSILIQSRLPDEVIIADDGSAQETRDVIEHYRSHFHGKLRHVWHADEGFKLAAIRNKAILVANHEYIVQIDGDLILHPHFIADHSRIAKPGKFVSGSRLLLSENHSKNILIKRQFPSFSRLFFMGENRLNAMRIPLFTRLLSPIYKRYQPYYVKGCNMAFWKNDLLAVNGYNEAITGWGKEDSELAIRLINHGTSRLFIKFGGICYHLHHQIASRKNEEANDRILSETLREGTTLASKGINSHNKDEITVT